MSARRLIVPLAAAVVLAVPGVASAGERSVSPTGSGIECSEAMPCTLAYGVLGAQVDDEVVLAPGTYDVSASPVLQPPHRIHVRGQEGAPRPVITSSAAAQQIFFIGQPAAGTKLSHLDLHVAARTDDALNGTHDRDGN